MSNQCKQTGFTLIEVMVVVAVVGILASVAYPAFLDPIRKARRAEAQSLLMDVANRQQQFLLDTRNYAASAAALNIAVPPSVSANYTFSMAVSTTTVPEFTVTLAAVGAQAKDTKCGELQVTHAGVKSPAACW